jgi:hypothetical protein
MYRERIALLELVAGVDRIGFEDVPGNPRDPFAGICSLTLLTLSPTREDLTYKLQPK